MAMALQVAGDCDCWAAALGRHPGHNVAYFIPSMLVAGAIEPVDEVVRRQFSWPFPVRYFATQRPGDIPDENIAVRRPIAWLVARSILDVKLIDDCLVNLRRSAGESAASFARRHWLPALDMHPVIYQGLFLHGEGRLDLPNLHFAWLLLARHEMALSSLYKCSTTGSRSAENSHSKSRDVAVPPAV